MGLIRFYGSALRFNGLTDGLVVPTGKYREAGIDLRSKEFSATVKSTKSHSTKMGLKHIASPSNPLNALRGAFTIDAYIIPDYGGVIIEKPGSFKLKYGNPFSTGNLIFEVYTNKGGVAVATVFDVPSHTQSNSGVYSSSSNAHRPQDLTIGEQGLYLVTAQFTQKEIKCFINGELVATTNLGGENHIVTDVSSDIYIGGQGGEFRGIIESIRLASGVQNPKLQPLTKTEDTFGLWEFNDEYDSPDIYFFDNARPGTPMQGRDGPDTHDGLLDIPMVGIGHSFSTTHFKIRDYPDNPSGFADRYTALEKLASLTQGIPLEEVRNQSWYTSTLDLTGTAYFTGVNSTVLNAVINHSGTSPITGVVTPPDTRKVQFSDNSTLSTSSTSTLNPSINRVERIRITGIDFANSRLNCTSIHLANDQANGTIDNFPETQGHLFAHTDNTPVWFTIGNADVLVDPGTNEVSGSVTNQRTREKHTFTLAHSTQGQRFSDASGYGNDAYFFSNKSRTTDSTDADTLYEPSTTYPCMGAVTSYSLVKGDFFLKMLPQPDEQKVKQTIQGIANTFLYDAEDITLQSLVSENERVKVTEPAYNGEISKVINKATTVTAVESGGSNVFNRIVVEHGVGFYETGISQNVSASTRDEIVAIAVSNPKPFMLKGLDTEHTAEISNGVPTNDNYIKHLTPEKEPRIATIESPSGLVSAGGPSKILIYYDAVDLTGEIVAGTGLANSGVSGASASLQFRKDHATGNAAYLVVKKTVPSGSAVFGARTVSGWLRRPYTGNQTDASAIKLTLTAPGGLVSLPTSNFNDRPASHVLSSNPTGDFTPSPFINIEDTVYSLGTGIRGYGRPKAIPSINTPDETSNADFHLLYFTGSTGLNRTNYATTNVTPSSLRRSNLGGFDVIDNELVRTGNLVLVHPNNKSRYNGLDDVASLDKASADPTSVVLEKTLMRGRIEEITPMIDSQDTKIVIRGRSLLMDVIDHRSTRDFNLAEGSPVKEIGDLGTPTVSMTLGGLGQGGIDIQPIYEEHPFLPGWKDKVVGTGNASVRNDKQASTYYASTRAITEIPLFPSMFYDVDNIIFDESRTPLPSYSNFMINIDCTMATNRPEMRENESRFAVDWGQRSSIASLEITNQIESWISNEDTDKRWLIRCQRPSVQAVVATTAYNTGTGVLTVDDASAFLKTNGERGLAANCADAFYVTIGEGVLNSGYGIVAKAEYTSGTTLTLTPAHTWNPLDTTSNYSGSLGNIDLGMTVTLGGYIVIGGANEASESPIIYDYTDSAIGNSTFSTGLGGFGATLASDLATAVRNLMGLNADAVHADPNNQYRYYILDGPNMEAFEWDPLETHESANDRGSLHPVICRTSTLALKGKKSNGSALEYVRPLIIDFSDVALKVKDFNGCVDEVIRRINMAGHPQAKNADGGSAFDPPPLFPLVATNKDTGTHMGYVRAFIGSSTESRDGESGVSIVIHSTVPGAAGRNFNVRLSNKTPYVYKPSEVIGYGGLLSTNSRLYRPNSFAAPLPIGEDGETFVPITTFRGAPSGSALDSTNSVRAYNGLGNSFVVTTVANVTGETLAGVEISAGTIKMTDPEFSNSFFDSPPTSLDHLAVSVNCEDYLKRITRTTSNNHNGALRINGMLATFRTITQQKTAASTDVGTNCFFIQDIRPRGNMVDFFRNLYDYNDGSPIDGVEVELIYPGVDGEGIVYFGGGHTGVTFDISDGTANDYSDDYAHHLSKGPTGFSGFQNLHEVSTASAVLDFTDITNNDTINENTLQGIHHKLRINSDGEIENNCRLYVRLNDAAADIDETKYVQSQQFKEALYGSYLRSTKGFDATTVRTAYSSGSTLNVDDYAAFSTGATHNAVTEESTVDSFTYTGTTSNNSGQILGVSNLSATPEDVYVVDLKGKSDADTQWEHTTIGPDGSTGDASGGGVYFKGNHAIATHYYPGSGSVVNSEYGPMKDFDCTQDFTISAWFKPTDDNQANSNETASGPIITGKDVNGRHWGLLMTGLQYSSAYQKIGFSFTYHNGTTTKTVTNTTNNSGHLLITDDAWCNIIVSKTGDTVTMHLGSQGSVRSLNSSTITQVAANSLVDLSTGTTDTITRSLASGTVGVVGIDATIPRVLGTTPKNSSCFIGLSTIKNIETYRGGSGVFHLGYGCGTTDGEKTLTSDGSNSTTDYGGAMEVWAFNVILSEIAIFDHVLTSTERTELFASTGVW